MGHRVVDLIIDESPVILAGYKVGKALSLTRWQIWGAKHPVTGNDDPPTEPWNDAWNEAFGRQRIGEIQRHLDILGTVPDPQMAQAVTVVSTGLGYWRNTLLNLPKILNVSSNRARSSRSEPAAEQNIKLPSEQESDTLATRLEEQLANWFDLLTGRRLPESFPSPASLPP